MKAFFTGIFTCFLLLEISAQEAIVYPYNPDADNDEIVGVTDLLPLLSVFGEDFQPGEILVDGVALAEVLMTMQQTMQTGIMIQTMMIPVAAAAAASSKSLALTLMIMEATRSASCKALNL